MYGIREIAKDKHNAQNIVNELLTIRIVAGTIVFSLYSLSLFLFFELSNMQKITFGACALYLLTYSFYTDWVLKGLEKFKLVAFGNIVTSLVFLGGIFFFVKTSNDIVATSFIWSLSFLAGSVSLILILYNKTTIKYKLTLNFRNWLRHLKGSIFFTLSGASNNLSRTLPILLLSLLTSTHEVGLFAAPYRCINSICNVGALLPVAFYPVLSDSYFNDSHTFFRIRGLLFKIMFAIGLLISLAGLFYGDKLIYLLFGHEYQGSIIALKLLVCMVFIIFVRYSFGIPILAMGLERSRAVAASAGLLMSLVSGFLLIPRYSVNGASICLLLSEGTTLGILIYIFHKKGVMSPRVESHNK